MKTRAWFGRLRTLLVRGRRLREHDDEAQTHLLLLAADLEERGWPADAARREARRRFGGPDQMREAYRDAAGFPSVDALTQDVRYGLRMLRRQPGFSMLVVLLVAIGVGANTAVFSFVDAVLLRRLPYADADRLVVVREVLPALAETYPSVPAAAGDFLLWQARVTAFDMMAAVAAGTETLTGAGDPARLDVARVTSTLFPLLGVTPTIGRAFTALEDQHGRGAVAVLSHGFWMERFGGDRAILGRALRLNDRAYTIIGVLPAGFALPRHDQLGALAPLPSRVDVYRPAAFSSEERQTLADNFNWIALARLRPGQTAEQAERQLNAVQREIVRQLGMPRPVELRARVIALQEQIVRHARRSLLLLTSAIGAVLVILCVNLATLLLTRATGRVRESAIRTALGASRGRVIRQVILEHLLLAGAGGVLGIAVAWSAMGVLTANAPIDVPRLDEVRLNGDVLAFGLGLSLVTGLTFSLLPAWRLGRTHPHAVLQGTGRSASDSAGSARLRSALVTAQVALSTVLLVVAALLTVSFLRLVRVDTGFRVEHVVFADLALSTPKYHAGPARVQFFDRLLDRLRAMPGVHAAALVSQPPLRGEAFVQAVSLEHDTRQLTELPIANIRLVDRDYFKALQIPLRRGRLFDDRDRDRSVAVINERTAAALWPGQDPLGQRLHHGGNDGPLREVVGVVADTREVNLQKAAYFMAYIPYWTIAPERGTVVLKSHADTGILAGAIRTAVWSIDAGVPVSTVTTLAEAVDGAVAPNRFQMLLVGAFAVSALLLATLGIYGVPAFSVARRTQELGIRLALGAPSTSLVRMVVREGLTPVAAGLALGLIGALAAGRLMQGLLFDVAPADPWVLGAVLALLAVVASIACYIPAHRVTRIDPVQALRWE
jgi:predicted permease